MILRICATHRERYAAAGYCPRCVVAPQCVIDAIKAGRLRSLYPDDIWAYKEANRIGVLVESIQANGYDTRRPVLYSTDGKLIDGAHRLAACIVLGITAPTAIEHPSSALAGSTSAWYGRRPSRAALQSQKSDSPALTVFSAVRGESERGGVGRRH